MLISCGRGVNSGDGYAAAVLGVVSAILTVVVVAAVSLCGGAHLRPLGSRLLPRCARAVYVDADGCVAAWTSGIPRLLCQKTTPRRDAFSGAHDVTFELCPFLNVNLHDP